MGLTYPVFWDPAMLDHFSLWRTRLYLALWNIVLRSMENVGDKILDVHFGHSMQLFLVPIAFRVLIQVELAPDDQMSDILVNTIRPIIVQDLVVPLVQKRRCCGEYRLLPSKPLSQNKVPDAPIMPLHLPLELQVPAKLRWYALEVGNFIVTNDFGNFRPGDALEVLIQAVHYVSVFRANVTEKLGTLQFVSRGVDVLLPVGQSRCSAVLATAAGSVIGTRCSTALRRVSRTWRSVIFGYRRGGGGRHYFVDCSKAQVTFSGSG